MDNDPHLRWRHVKQPAGLDDSSPLLSMVAESMVIRRPSPSGVLQRLFGVMARTALVAIGERVRRRL